MFCTRVLIYSEDDSEEETSDSEESVGTCNSPSSYRQPGGRGQFLSRRYCTHSVWFLLCASRTASSSQGHFGGFVQVLQTV